MTLPPNRSILRRSAFAAALLVGTSLGAMTLHARAQTAAPVGAPVNPVAAQAEPRALADFSGLVARVRPAVVSITNKMGATPASFDEDSEAGPQGQQLPFPFSKMVPQQRQHAVEARGSGFIVSAEGLIVTNNHVVKNAKTLSVTLDDGTVLPAKVVGTDPRTDIAVLKIDAPRPMPFIQLGNSRDVKPGEWVVAMGNPFGLSSTVTAGIVSAVSRDIGQGPYDQFIQIDAPINQGNSGGPLFTQDGKVIGMNTAIFSPTGGSVGIGFAIPSDMIRTVTAQLEKTGHVVRGYVGVEAQAITPATAKAMHLKDGDGALLAGIQPEGPAAKAGLQPGDVIQQVNGTKVANPKDLAVDISSVAPGETVHLTVLRDGAAKEVAVTVGQMPGEQTAANDRPAGAEQRGRLGLALAPLSPELRGELDVPEAAKGAVIRGVQPGSPAETAGLQPGDVIVGVGSKPVASPAEASRAIGAALKADGNAVALRILRKGEPLFVGVAVDQDAQG